MLKNNCEADANISTYEFKVHSNWETSVQNSCRFDVWKSTYVISQGPLFLIYRLMSIERLAQVWVIGLQRRTVF